MNKVKDLENGLETKERRIKYLEARIASKKQELVPCQSISTQVSTDTSQMSLELRLDGDLILLELVFKVIFQWRLSSKVGCLCTVVVVQTRLNKSIVFLYTTLFQTIQNPLPTVFKPVSRPQSLQDLFNENR